MPSCCMRQHPNGLIAPRKGAKWVSTHSISREQPESVVGHSRQGRASSKSGHVRYARKAEVIFRALAAPRQAVSGWWYCINPNLAARQ
jgi:predicted secreted hydrolase